jgi:hypothetical protein
MQHASIGGLPIRSDTDQPVLQEKIPACVVPPEPKQKLGKSKHLTPSEPFNRGTPICVLRNACNVISNESREERLELKSAVLRPDKYFSVMCHRAYTRQSAGRASHY